MDIAFLVQFNPLHINIFLLIFIHDLGHNDSQNTVLELGRDAVFVNLDSLLESDFSFEGADLALVESEGAHHLLIDTRSSHHT